MAHRVNRIETCLDEILAKEDITNRDLAIAMKTFISEIYVDHYRKTDRIEVALFGTPNDPFSGLVYTREWLCRSVRILAWTVTGIVSTAVSALLFFKSMGWFHL